MNEIIPGLFLGAMQATKQKKALEQIGITLIVSVAGRAKTQPEGCTIKRIGIEDS